MYPLAPRSLGTPGRGRALAEPEPYLASNLRRRRRKRLLAAAASSVVSGVDMGYAGSSGLEPQQFVSNNQPCGYICYGFGEFDGQNSGHDFSGNVSARALLLVLVPNRGSMTKALLSISG